MFDDEKQDTTQVDIESQVRHKRGFTTRILHIALAATTFYLLRCNYQQFFHSFKEDNNYPLDSSLILTTLQTNEAGKWMREFTEDNQLAGTNMRLVNYTAHQFSELGLDDVFVDEYTSYMSYPLENGLHLYSTKKKDNKLVYTAKLREAVVDEDSNSSYDVPAFLGYAANGNVTAQYVYCNYGTLEDFEKLVELGVDLKGKIAIIRYGKLYRGLKIKFAQDYGMSAALLYTDIYDDGDVTEKNGFEAYPKGFARNPSAIQRGSALFLSYTPGDPTTPGYAIKPGEKNDRKDPYNTIPRIPALPISHEDVAPILKQLSGHGPKVDGWTGLIDGFDYSIGPNPSYELNLYNKQEFNISTMHNIMGKITGADDSKFILVGNHHDSWTPAAADPHSGTAAMLEVIRAFGELKKTGWKPRVSIVFASWDGEEYGLLGSTEYAEYHAHTLKKSCIAYINTDVAAIGNILTMSASPLLNDVLLTSTKELTYSNSTQSLYDHFMSHSGKIGTLGSGSDYTVFLEHLGIPSLDLGFANDQHNSSVYQYHSLYDSLHWMEKFGDPGYVYHNLMAKLMSLVVLHLSDEPVLKLRTHDYANAINGYFEDLDIPESWANISEVSYTPPPKFDMLMRNDNHPCSKSHSDLPVVIAQVREKLAALILKTDDFDAKLEDLVKEHENWDHLSYWERIKLHFKTKGMNAALTYFERHLLDHEGLKDRSWFKHVVYASGRYTGYQGQQLPGLAEALEDDDKKLFTHKLRKFKHILGSLVDLATL